MKTVFGVTFFLLLAASFALWNATPPPPGGGTKTVLVWVTDDNPVRKGQVALFNQLNPDLHLMIDPANNDQSKVIVQSIGGIGPDLFDTYGASSLETYVNAGIAWDLTDELKAAGIDENMVWPVARPSFVRDGRIYGFPCNVNADAVWFNKDIFDAEGIPYPKSGWTWEEFIATAQKLTKRDARGKAQRFGFYMDWGGYPNLIKQHGGRIWSEDGVRCVIDSAESTAAVQLAHDLMYRHKIMPSPQEEAALSTQGGWGSGGMTFFMGNRTAMALGGRWWLNLLRQTDEEDRKSGKKPQRRGVVELPYAKYPVMQGGARCTLVNRRSPRREAAVRFIKYLASREYNELLDRQADALAPVKAISYTDLFLNNPDHPEEDFNAVWRRVVENSQPEEVNPFVKGAEIQPLNTQTDLIRANLKPVPQALRDAAVAMNERIQNQIRAKPHLRELYRQKTGREFER